MSRRIVRQKLALNPHVAITDCPILCDISVTFAVYYLYSEILFGLKAPTHTE